MQSCKLKTRKHEGRPSRWLSSMPGRASCAPGPTHEKGARQHLAGSEAAKDEAAHTDEIHYFFRP
jgi:hypothetical protein